MEITVQNVHYAYSQDGPTQRAALTDVSFTLPAGQFVALIGHTGSGKSTLVQLLNGLIKPTSGKVWVDGKDITTDDAARREARRKVGLVFQYPEYQLFEETVKEDIAFGPKKMGMTEEEIEARVKEVAGLVGLSEEMMDKSPFELSGGQKRRVAIAGVLAMDPQVLILDEPTAGLDPGGREEILENIRALHETTGKTILLVSHSMEDVARFAERILVMSEGALKMDGSPKEIFREEEALRDIGLGVPEITKVMKGLREKGIMLPEDIFTAKEAAEAIMTALEKQKEA